MSALPGFTPYQGFLQLAYVTTDFDRALAEFGERYGVPRWLELRDLEIETGENRSCRAHVALSFVGPTQLELIQPLQGDDTVYRYRLPDDGYALCINHIAQLIGTEAEYEALRAQTVALGVPIAMEGIGGGGSTRYFYTDFRDKLGHYLEHIWYSPEGLAFLRGNVPQNLATA
jgi:hypothetical protein